MMMMKTYRFQPLSSEYRSNWGYFYLITHVVPGQVHVYSQSSPVQKHEKFRAESNSFLFIHYIAHVYISFKLNRALSDGFEIFIISSTSSLSLSISLPPGSPYTLEIVDASQVTAAGEGLSTVEVNRRAAFIVNTGHISSAGELRVDVTGTENIQLIKHSKNKYSIDKIFNS